MIGILAHLGEPSEPKTTEPEPSKKVFVFLSMYWMNHNIITEVFLQSNIGKRNASSRGV